MHKRSYVLIILMILIAFLLITGCTTEKEGSNKDKNNNNEETNGGTTDQNNTESDPCGNEIGNGLEIVRGPLEPDRPADRDSVFYSLAVDPLNQDIVFVGTERNGIFKC